MAERDEEEQRGRSFTVQDRRRFTDTESGERATERDDAVPSRHAAERLEAAASQRPAEGHEGAAEWAPDASAHGDAGERGGARLAEVTFSTFVMGLTTQALMHLGEIADPVEQQVGRDLPAAKQMIDLLGILSDKTRGNLDAAEEQLLKSMLYDLRMRYVEAARGR